MAPALAPVVDTLRRPEYTGENRCLPCTVVNVLAAAVLAVAAATLATPVGPVVAALFATGVLLVSLATIYLRGYLVPGTPRFTGTYVPDWLLRAFEKEADVPAGRRFGGLPAESDVGAFLARAGVVTAGSDGDGRRPTAEFRAAWRDRVAGVREDGAAREAFAARHGIEPGRLSFETFGGAYVALLDHREVGQWPSRAAFLADVAAAGELERRHDGWTDLDLDSRRRVLGALRRFVDRCPSCDGPVEVDETVVESCCRANATGVVAATCRACGARVYETRSG